MKLRSIFQVLLLSYLISTLILPTFIANKIIFVIVLMLIVIKVKDYKPSTLSPFYVIILFSYGMFISYFNSVDRDLATQFFLSTLSLLIIYPILEYKIEFEKYIKISGLILVIYTLLSFLLIVVYFDSPISTKFYLFFIEFSAGSNSLREFTDEGVLSFHTGTAPFIFLTLILFFESYLSKKRLSILVIILLHVFVILISGSRGTFFSSLLAILVLSLLKGSYRIKLALLLLGIPLILYALTNLLQSTSIFSSDEGSNSVKIGHFESFIDSRNITNLMFGEGLGSTYYSKGSGMNKAHTEITPLDMIRYIGLPFSLLLYSFIVFPSNNLKYYSKKNVAHLIIFLIYLLNSMTNPTMFNSYGLIVVLWYWYKILLVDRRIYNNNLVI
ncbi:MAG: hypothetical protein RL164_1056 [Bacteroidota bacterium]|jgi:hypothetical protein